MLFEMDVVNIFNKINEIGWGIVVIAAILLLSLWIAMKELAKKALSSLGLRTNASIEKERLMQTINDMQKEIETCKSNRIHDREQFLEIQKELTETQSDIKQSLDSLTKMFVKKDIDDMRWDILDFGSGIISNRKYSKEQYDHVFEIYQDYEKVLEENNMENGRVDMSMEFIRKKYAEKMETGFDK